MKYIKPLLLTIYATVGGMVLLMGGIEESPGLIGPIF